ncbi:ABC transporter substrate-binding protein [Bradyrhizobium prioriisuperbiae]|uniref:ABC transporter substrate-binding protein n=1 Tax=Bradyrhizobium prioriisuperbiae TaxID=2854389 RepID=UPI0028ED3C7B|nr:ABC transporter substrate-binding protein [Bradyrhizobium prioritasuperba]
MERTALRIGVSDSDRTRPLVSGEVEMEGVAADIEVMGVQVLFNRQLTEHTFDCCEFPLTSYLRTLERPDRRYVGLPVFPSRHFRLSSVFINKTRGIRSPADLAGRRIGVPVFDMAAAVWLRGIFHDQFGLDRASPIYVAGGLEAPRAGDEHPQFYPARFKHEQCTDRSLASMLASGEIDALYTARAPSTWPSATVGRLFEDPMTAELGYFDRTGVFPAMHLVAIKRSIVEKHLDLPMAVFKAFAAAQEVAQSKLADSTALSTMLPWQLENLLLAKQRLGADYWPAGVAKNKAMLEAIIRYMAEDGLIEKQFAIEDIFEGADILAT